MAGPGLCAAPRGAAVSRAHGWAVDLRRRGPAVVGLPALNALASSLTGDSLAWDPIPFCRKGSWARQAGMRTDGKPSGSVALIKTAMIEKKITQAELADAADCHEKTIQNLLAGRPVRDQTLFDVCMVLGLDFARVK